MVLAGDKGYGRPGSLLWHKNAVYSCASTKELAEYVTQVIGKEFKIPKHISLNKAQTAVMHLLRRKVNDE